MSINATELYPWIGGSDVKMGPMNFDGFLNPSFTASVDNIINVFDRTPDIGSGISCPYVSTLVDLVANVSAITAMKIKNNGTRLYVLRGSTSTIFQYNLTVAYDVSYASFTGSFAVNGVVGTAYDFDISEDGSKLIVLGNTSPNSLYEYTLSTPWLISSSVYQSRSYSMNGQDTQMRRIKISKNGLRVLSFGDVNDSIFQYTLGSSYNLTSVTYNTNINLSSLITSPGFSNIRGFTATNNNTRLLVAYTQTGGGQELIRELHLSDDLLLSGAFQGRLTRVKMATGGSIVGIEASDTYDTNKNLILYGDSAAPTIAKTLLNLKPKGFWIGSFLMGIRYNGSVSGETRLKNINISTGPNLTAYNGINDIDFMAFEPTQNIRNLIQVPLDFITDIRTKIDAVIFPAAAQAGVFNLSLGFRPIL
jgi:hypothetical protein